MLVSHEQKQIYQLAMLVLQQHQLQVATLHSGHDVHFPGDPRQDIRAWAIAYALNLPPEPQDQERLRQLHLNPLQRWTAEQSRRAATCYKTFYRRLQDERLYAVGLRWLNSGGRQLLATAADS
ncbi:hypothetical protein [Desulfuromonas thiophila]|jgi:hypothetical protein|uniref:hypothetical protein n=1 Tax=Desulfuromonas thiophila TaxID=57664 RepID=UPI0024A95B08|nr:hypothetical protein [Desulfuromonas thiophila]